MDPKYITATVAARREITSELWVVRVRPAEKISFAAGQYVTIGLAGGAGRLVERPYSVASSPQEPELEFFLELVRHGRLTPQLYDVGVGGEVFLRRGAKGRFVFDTASGRPNHFLIATVTGVAPYVAMVRDLAARAERGELVPYRLAVLQGASSSAELGYREELTAVAARHPWFQYIPTVSRIWTEPDWEGEVGRCEDVARKHLDALGFRAANTTAYVCGNPTMIENVKGVLQRAGFPKESVREEVYWVAEKAASS